MIYQFLWKMLIMEKSKKLIFLHQKDAKDVMDMAQNQDPNQFHVQYVVVRGG